MLEVDGRVEVEFDGGRGYLVADGARLVLDVDDPSAAARVLNHRTLRALGRRLSSAGLTLHVRTGGRPVLTAGRDARRRFPARSLRSPDLRVSPWFALRSVRPWRRHGLRPMTPPGGTGRKPDPSSARAATLPGSTIMTTRPLRLRAGAAILLAASASFALSVTLWFTGSHEQGIFVGLWVPSILSFGAVALQMSDSRHE